MYTTIKVNKEKKSPNDDTKGLRMSDFFCQFTTTLSQWSCRGVTWQFDLCLTTTKIFSFAAQTWMTGGFEKKDADKKDKTCIFIVTPEIGIRKIIIA